MKVMEEKQAERVSILLMNPQNGEIYACVNVPEFDLNDPFTLNIQTEQWRSSPEKKKQDLLNQMWRNPCLNDTYEPGSTFKIITMAAGLEAGVVSEDDRFYCPGYKAGGRQKDPLCEKNRPWRPEFCGRSPEFLQPCLHRGGTADWEWNGIINTSASLGFLTKQVWICREKQGLSCMP